VSGTETSECGRFVPWIDSRSGELRRLQLRPKEFAPACPPDMYWMRLPFLPRINWGHLVSGGDVPAHVKSESFWERMPRAEDAEEALVATDALLDEAVTHKRWSIPPGAILDLRVGPFVSLQLWEGEHEISFVGRSYDFLGLAGTAHLRHL
jgi:hypothetical protein